MEKRREHSTLPHGITRNCLQGRPIELHTCKENIKVAAISETKKLRGSKGTNNYLQFYHGVGKNERAQAGVMLIIHESLRSVIDSYTFWNERILEVRLKTPRG
jgi:hypothetical protein